MTEAPRKALRAKQGDEGTGKAGATTSCREGKTPESQNSLAVQSEKISGFFIVKLPTKWFSDTEKHGCQFIC